MAPCRPPVQPVARAVLLALRILAACALPSMSNGVGHMCIAASTDWLHQTVCIAATTLLVTLACGGFFSWLSYSTRARRIWVPLSCNETSRQQQLRQSRLLLHYEQPRALLLCSGVNLRPDAAQTYSNGHCMACAVLDSAAGADREVKQRTNTTCACCTFVGWRSGIFRLLLQCWAAIAMCFSCSRCSRLRQRLQHSFVGQTFERKIQPRISAVIMVVDIGSDVYTAMALLEAGYYSFAGWSIFFVFLPYIVAAVFMSFKLARQYYKLHTALDADHQVAEDVKATDSPDRSAASHHWQNAFQSTQGLPCAESGAEALGSRWELLFAMIG